MPRKGQVKRDYVGKQFGSLTVLDEYVRKYVNHGTNIYWKCRCSCGNEFFVERGSLRTKKHDYCPKCRPPGVRHEKLYHIYHGIKQRCYNPKAPGFDIYGGKGVKMCAEWLAGYDSFREWSLQNGYIQDAGLSIDRIDSNGDYCPENCQWITLGENTARSNYGRQQVFTKLKDVYAISPDGERVDIINISKFSRDNNLNVSGVGAALHGRIGPYYHGWFFHSDKSRHEKCNDYRKHTDEEISSGRSK